MIEKSDSKWLSLATVPILGQPPSKKLTCIVNQILDKFHQWLAQVHLRLRLA